MDAADLGVILDSQYYRTHTVNLQFITYISSYASGMIYRGNMGLIITAQNGGTTCISKISVSHHGQ